MISYVFGSSILISQNGEGNSLSLVLHQGNRQFKTVPSGATISMGIIPLPTKPRENTSVPSIKPA